MYYVLMDVTYINKVIQVKLKTLGLFRQAQIKRVAKPAKDMQAIGLDGKVKIRIYDNKIGKFIPGKVPSFEIIVI